ncbi:CC/Se motif family (seleno)protein [Bacillus sp. FJAT-44742]|uniref:CC/Se motif family (seleno)protein n=1 Tax=Bacillus sp. FJAT-44742 TaxID=2014005 RepID=UPI000C2355EE|nr:CC/Se motif family (seleno)protein [Bacillus sp. FJAT-44742]
MKININAKTRAWIMKRGGAVTIDPFHPLHGVVQSKSVDTILSHGTPEEESFYNKVVVNDVLVYVHKGLEEKKDVKMHITGYGPFEHLHVSGLRRKKK